MNSLLWRVFALILFVAVFSVEILRIRSPSGPLNATVIHFFRPFLRAHETTQFAGIAYYVAGVAFTSLFFPRDCATIAILVLAVVDPAAAFAGTYFESTLPSLRLRHGKSIPGFVTSALITSVVVFIVISCATSTSLDPSDAWMLSVLSASVAAIVEFAIPSPRPTLPFPKFPISLDDNMFIPILCAATVEFVLRVTYHRFNLSSLLLTNLS